MKKGLLMSGILLTLFLVGCEETASTQSGMNLELKTARVTLPSLEKRYNVPITLNRGVQAGNPLVSEAINLVSKNMLYATNEDLNGYLSTLKSTLATSKDARVLLEAVYNNYDLTYNIKGIDIESVTANKVILDIKYETVATKVLNGFTFKNKAETTKNVLIKENGHLVYSDTQLVAVSYLQ